MGTFTQKAGFKYWPLVISLAITLSIGIVAAIFTEPQVRGWYVHLNKPTFNPPNWLFGPTWTVLYIMIAVSAYRVWLGRSKAVAYIYARRTYIFQLLFNFSWSIVFFGMHQVFAALIVIAVLWVSIIVLIYLFSRIDKIAAWLLVPYLLWVSFASLLNFSIYVLNKAG